MDAYTFPTYNHNRVSKLVEKSVRMAIFSSGIQNQNRHQSSEIFGTTQKLSRLFSTDLRKRLWKWDGGTVYETF